MLEIPVFASTKNTMTSASRMASMTWFKTALWIKFLESGKYPLNIQKISVCSVIEPAIELLKEKASESKSKLYLDRMHDTHAFGDPDAVNEVLTNLINNALVHTPEGTEVSVSANKISDDFMEIVVRDNGQGIDEEALARVFDRFVQINRKSGPGYRGSGIGLAVCKALVEKMGGTISAQSVPGRGTEFKFTLPRTPPQEPYDASVGTAGGIGGHLDSDRVDMPEEADEMASRNG